MSPYVKVFLVFTLFFSVATVALPKGLDKLNPNNAVATIDSDGAMVAGAFSNSPAGTLLYSIAVGLMCAIIYSPFSNRKSKKEGFSLERRDQE